MSKIFDEEEMLNRTAWIAVKKNQGYCGIEDCVACAKGRRSIEENPWTWVKDDQGEGFL